MELSMSYYVMMMFIMPSLSSYAFASSSCPVMKPFLHDLQLQCPTTIVYSSPIKMNGEALDKLLSSNLTNAYIAILFYASWCPFSKNVQPKFDALSSMYPQIKHIMVEQSSVPPIVFSRYRIHGVPSILITSRTTRMQHHGPKELSALMHFYQQATRLEPVVDLTEDQISFLDNKSITTKAHDEIQLRSIISEELYLIFSMFFLFIKALLYLYPNMVSNFIALWLAYIPHLNLAIFGESRQLLARVLQLVDFKRAFVKPKLVRSACEWTSWLASFSFCKTSSPGASQDFESL